jgi:hypothetical protein
MNCDDARRLIGADPRTVPEELAGHLASCTACTRYREEMLVLERDLRRALTLPAPVRSTSSSRPAMASRAARSSRRFATRGPWALAASVLLTAVAALLLFAVRPTDTLARDVVQHVSDEPDSWSPRSQVSGSALAGVLERAGIARTRDASPVTYAQTCRFHGGWVPHLVVLTAQGPYTVIVLRGTHTPARRYFNEGGYSGLLLPADGGTFVVLERGSANADAAAADVSRSLKFLP